MHKIKALILLLLATFLMGCATGNTSIADETNQTLRQKIVRGKTTKADLVRTFGEPSEKGTNNGKEYWAYQTAQSSPMGVMPYANLIPGATEIKGKYLYITFNKRDVVTSYDLRETKI